MAYESRKFSNKLCVNSSYKNTKTLFRAGWLLSLLPMFLTKVMIYLVIFFEEQTEYRDLKNKVVVSFSTIENFPFIRQTIIY